MRLHHFFIQEKIGDEKEIVLNDAALFHQLRNVFRFNVGSQAVLLDNTGFEYLSEITSYARGSLALNIISKTENLNVPKKEIYLFQSIIKKNNFEFILEKGTEIGVSHFVPLVTDRSEKKDINIERGKKIIKEASEQSERGKMPDLFEAETLDHIFKDLSIPFVAFDPQGEKFEIKKYEDQNKIGILIGPEGGWSDKEVALFKEKNIPIHSLGNQVLRAETAAVVIPSLFLLNY